MIALSSTSDQRDLILSVAGGIHEDPPWTSLARNLATRTRADHVLIATRQGKTVRQATFTWDATTLPKGEIGPAHWPSFLATFITRGAPLRAGRVYAADELFAFDQPDVLAAQRNWLARNGVASVRLLRVAAHDDTDVMVILANQREEIQSASVATLSNLAPHLIAALHSLEVIAKQLLARELAEFALARLGIGQLAFDAEGAILFADHTAQALLDLAPHQGPGTHRRMRLSAKAGQDFKALFEQLAAGTGSDVRIMSLGEPRDLCLLLRRAPVPMDELAHGPAVIGAVRNYRPQQTRETALAIKELYQLSDREASLAHAISLGQPIIDSGQKLRLTKETARNYSKRIYLKTGTKGQSDLARLILNGLAPLA